MLLTRSQSSAPPLLLRLQSTSAFRAPIFLWISTCQSVTKRITLHSITAQLAQCPSIVTNSMIVWCSDNARRSSVFETIIRGVGGALFPPPFLPLPLLPLYFTTPPPVLFYYPSSRCILLPLLPFCFTCCAGLLSARMLLPAVSRPHIPQSNIVTILAGFGEQCGCPQHGRRFA